MVLLVDSGAEFDIDWGIGSIGLVKYSAKIQG